MTAGVDEPLEVKESVGINIVMQTAVGYCVMFPATVDLGVVIPP